jgi:hypothetical protein
MAALMSVLTAAVMIAGAVPPAAAGSRNPSRAVLQDGAGDVWASRPGPGPLTFVPAPGKGRSADFTRVLIRHRHRALGIQMKFVDLQPRGEQTVVIGLETPFLYTVMVRASRGRDGAHGLFNPVTEIDCPGFTHEINYSADRISVRIPRSCIEEPEWVTVQLRSRLTGHSAAPPYNDNPHNGQALGGGESVGPLYREAAEGPTARAPTPAAAEE